jgi:hypothetical protein
MSLFLRAAPRHLWLPRARERPRARAREAFHARRGSPQSNPFASLQSRPLGSAETTGFVSAPTSPFGSAEYSAAFALPQSSTASTESSTSALTAALAKLPRGVDLLRTGFDHTETTFRTVLESLADTLGTAISPGAVLNKLALEIPSLRPDRKADQDHQLQAVSLARALFDAGETVISAQEKKALADSLIRMASKVSNHSHHHDFATEREGGLLKQEASMRKHRLYGLADRLTRGALKNTAAYLNAASRMGSKERTPDKVVKMLEAVIKSMRPDEVSDGLVKRATVLLEGMSRNNESAIKLNYALQDKTTPQLKKVLNDLLLPPGVPSTTKNPGP